MFDAIVYMSIFICVKTSMWIPKKKAQKYTKNMKLIFTECNVPYIRIAQSTFKHTHTLPLYI